MTEEMVEIPRNSLDRIHGRNKQLDTENRVMGREIEVLKSAIEKLTLRGLRLSRDGV